MTGGKGKMADDRPQMTDPGCQIARGERQQEDAVLEMKGPAWEMADGKWQMVDGR